MTIDNVVMRLTTCAEVEVSNLNKLAFVAVFKSTKDTEVLQQIVFMPSLIEDTFIVMYELDSVHTFILDLQKDVQLIEELFSFLEINVKSTEVSEGFKKELVSLFTEYGIL